MSNNFNDDPTSRFFVNRGGFAKAYGRGFWRRIFSQIRRTDNHLLPFNEVMHYIPRNGEHYLGVKQIETSKIVGSVNRFQDFDRAFLPLQTYTRERWERINAAYYRDAIFPPIEVYKISDIYFVRDGHHRVSVAREQGQAYIDAYVIEIDTNGKLDENTNLNDLIQTHEYQDFLDRSKLGKVVPNVDFHFSIPGQYGRLLQHIDVHRWYMGEKLNRPIEDEEAALGWYKEVYHPLIRIIRNHKIMKEFPQRTETDLYLRIIEHRMYLAEDFHQKVSLETAAAHFAREFSQRPVNAVINFFRKILEKIFNQKRPDPS